MRTAAVLALVLLVSACASGEPDFGAWLDEEPRSVRLVVDNAALPDTEYYVMETRYGAGAWKGAGSGAILWLFIMSECNQSGCLAAFLVVLPVAMVGGAVAGVAAAEPEVVESWPLAESESTRPLAAVVAEVTPPVGEHVGDLVAQLVRDEGEHTVLVVSAEEAAALGPGETDATVSLDILGTGLHGAAGEDPKSYFQVEVAVRAVWDTGIQESIYRLGSRRVRLSKWNAESYLPVREAITGLEGKIAKSIKEDWFGRPPGIEL